MELYIGNKNYSSWSLRPWLLMKHFGIPFTERLVSVAGRGVHEMHRAYSNNGLVPCLHIEKDFQIWDTLAIAEYLAETYPEKHLYPVDRLARARARSISAEMHSGFGQVRGSMFCNIKMRLKGVAQGAQLSPEVASEIARISEIWRDAREEFGKATGKPYLFGEFSIADAMFAPVVWRFFSYNVPLEGEAKAYLDTMLAHPFMLEWEQSALAETVALAHYDDAVLASYGGPR